MSLNIGTMTGKSRELADTMTRRKIDIACIQETKWKGATGVAIVVGEKWRDNILEVNRISDRLCLMKKRKSFGKSWRS